MENRQTISYVANRLKAAGLRPVNRFGQNFLVDLNLIELIARSADLGPRDVVLEVGTGTGSLTAKMAKRAAQVVTVEIDENLAELARQEFATLPNVTLLQTDALKNKNTLHPEVVRVVQEKLAAAGPQARLKLVANLPYNVATPIISNILLFDPVPERIVVTIQRELAERIIAAPSTKDYSALSIWVQTLAHPRIVRVLPPSVFWPRPKVHSAILQIDPSDELRRRVHDLDFYHRTVRALYFHRRKFLRSVVVSAMKERLDKATVDQLLDELGMGATTRAEELSVEQTIELIERLRQATAA
ncbi:16S rRNA (adenine(1518)-N(6)/adenine(1519)-N(6))-dimethyltransferase RsmA [Candidatus Laterigemmans baculatus]|uniref:16S rRNA (adenine(1518)-N(6)/adenine(1519)-N(6))- dimethyltransferase RsmA n=1 Tax=Candidatus Laterigemmans baculatus TaxID=2770505 RepID=UPI0013DA800A|nr:16S rRNA (adenine(1518)-N(6)/adenine(1519)-N(6))-dimethyltransferase RsmA [Candidatus Laterigemmans baculatus]